MEVHTQNNLDAEILQTIQNFERAIESENNEKFRVKYEKFVRDQLRNYSEFALPDFFSYLSKISSNDEEKRRIVIEVVDAVRREFVSDIRFQKRLFRNIAHTKINQWIEQWNSDSNSSELDILGNDISGSLEEFCKPIDSPVNFGSCIAKDSIYLYAKFEMLRKWASKHTNDDLLLPITSITEFYPLEEKDMFVPAPARE